MAQQRVFELIIRYPLVALCAFVFAFGNAQTFDREDNLAVLGVACVT